MFMEIFNPLNSNHPMKKVIMIKKIFFDIDKLISNKLIILN